jgi:hypothetical protein
MRLLPISIIHFQGLTTQFSPFVKRAAPTPYCSPKVVVLISFAVIVFPCNEAEDDPPSAGRADGWAGFSSRLKA